MAMRQANHYCNYLLDAFDHSHGSDVANEALKPKDLPDFGPHYTFTFIFTHLSADRFNTVVQRMSAANKAGTKSPVAAPKMPTRSNPAVRSRRKVETV